MGKPIKGRLFALAVVLVLVLLPGAGPLASGQAQAPPGARVIYVPDDYPAIQGAVDASTPGDTIIVRDGNYTANIVVTTDHLTIKSQNGAGSTIVTAADPGVSVFDVVRGTDYVSIAGFTVSGATAEYQAGIHLYQNSYCDLRDNIALNNYEGIFLENSYNNTLTNNTATGNFLDGILVRDSGNNTLTNNTAWNNTNFGIRLYFSAPNTLRSNSMAGNRLNFYSWSWESLSELCQDVDTSNMVDGKPVYLLLDKSDLVIDSSTSAGYVAVINSTNITVKDLNLTHSGFGVLFAFTNSSRIENVTGSYCKHSFLLYESHNNTLVNDIAANNIFDGFRIWNSRNNILLNSTSDRNRLGACLDSSDNNTLINNTFSNSSQWGILLKYSSNNTIYLNDVVNNTGGLVLSDSSTDFWNSTSHTNDPVNGTLGNVLSWLSTAIWDSTRKLTYSYNGSNCTGYLGNYWGDYRANQPGAAEVGSRGVGDTPYDIQTKDDAVPQADNYPLVAPVSHYQVTGVAPSCPLANGRYWWALVVAGVIIALYVIASSLAAARGRLRRGNPVKNQRLKVKNQNDREKS